MSRNPRKAAVPVQAALRVDLVALSAITRWPRNPKRHAVVPLEGSIDRFGFVAPLIVDEASGKLVAGHGRLDALQAMQASGGAPPERVALGPGGEWLVPVLRGVAFRTEADAEGYLLADNRHSELGGWDDGLLAAVLGDLRAGDALAGTGWSEHEVDALLRAAEPPIGPDPFSPEDVAPAPVAQRSVAARPYTLYFDEAARARVTATLQQVADERDLANHSQALISILDDWEGLCADATL